MTLKMLIIAAFLGQIALISYWIPRQRLGRLLYLMDAYPPATHPRLYPRPIEFYERAQRSYRLANRFMVLLGLTLAGVLWIVPGAEEWTHFTLTSFFLLQMTPLVLLDRGSLGLSDLFRQAQGSQRTADLRPRRVRDYAPSHLVWTAVAAFAVLLGVLGYASTLNLEWFSAGANLAVLGGGHLFMLMLATWTVRRRKSNPFQATEDHDRQLEFVVRTMLLTSIAVTLYAAGSITMAALELRHFQALGLTLYFQLLAWFSLTPPHSRNFEVYREEPATS